MHLCLFKYISICINIYTSRDSDLLYILLLLLLFSHPVTQTLCSPVDWSSPGSSVHAVL